MSHGIEIVKEQMQSTRARKQGAQNEDVELIAVSKMFAADKIIPVLEAGPAYVW